MAIYTAPCSAPATTPTNRATVRAAATADLDLFGLAARAPQHDADAILRGLKRHP